MGVEQVADKILSDFKARHSPGVLELHKDSIPRSFVRYTRKARHQDFGVQKRHVASSAGHLIVGLPSKSMLLRTMVKKELL